MDFSKLLIHASQYSKLTTEPKSAADKAAGKMSATTKSVVRQMYIEKKYSRRKEITCKQMEKGILQEQAGIELYSKFKGRTFVKNAIRLYDDYITGEPDFTDNENILNCTEGFDMKCSWSIHTFPFPDDKLPDSYEWQNQSYMRLLKKAQRWTTVYVLVNTPAHLINDEKMKLWYKLGKPEQNEDQESPEAIIYAEYIELSIEIEKNCIYDMETFKKENPGFDLDCKNWTYDIPISERIREFVSIRDDEKIKSMPITINSVRDYMNELDRSLIYP